MKTYRVPRPGGLGKVKLFERVVGQAVALVVPDGYREMMARVNAPRPQVALKVKLIGDTVKSVKLAGEREEREPRGRMTLEHPFMVKLLADYMLLERYELRSEPGVVVENYVVAGEQGGQGLGAGGWGPGVGGQEQGGRGEKEPALVRAGPGHCMVVEASALSPALALPSLRSSQGEKEPEIRALSPAEEIALGLKAEYPELEKAIDLALAAVAAGLESSYETWWDNAGRYGTVHCNCPQAVYRNPRTRFGAGCKHGLALTIGRLLEQRQAELKNREVEKRQERITQGVRAKFATDAAPGDGGRLASDYETMQPTPAYRQMLEREAARREREAARPATAQAGSVLDWLDDEPRPSPRPSPRGRGSKTGADIIREIEAENAERYARENAGYAAALRADRVNLAARPNFERKGVGGRGSGVGG